MNEDAAAFVLLGGLPTYEEYLHRCLQLGLTAEQMRDTFMKINMTSNKGIQYRYLREIGYFVDITI